ncbi:hypothetical protein CY35_07G099200 [Sphagnum magellanicum]|uniref:Uncharacterized protein n=1 Tax=Sphagnum magellanicum TaxID=128215 RepID=A0ACB8HNF6_9BRYO|nr:hypothetical protein CY35_07G099200 [Sphagnum magellanicum]
MALYHGVENDVEFVSSRPTSRDLSPTLEDADLEEVLMGYPNISQAPFANLVAFKRTFMTCLRSLVELIPMNCESVIQATYLGICSSFVIT